MSNRRSKAVQKEMWSDATQPGHPTFYFFQLFYNTDTVKMAVVPTANLI